MLDLYCLSSKLNGISFLLLLLCGTRDKNVEGVFVHYGPSLLVNW